MSERVKISPYDPAYPLNLFSDSMKEQAEKACVTLKEVYRSAVKRAPFLFQLKHALTKEFTLTVAATPEQVELLRSGAAKLVTTKDGRTIAQLRMASGQFGEHIAIKAEDVMQGIDPVQLTTAMQMQVIQGQLEDITQQLQIIDQNVRSVLQGQQNDRIGKYYSGISLYLEASKISDKTFKSALLAQAQAALSEASFQLSENMRSDIHFLRNGEYKGFGNGGTKAIDEHIQNINTAFQYIHESALMRAAIYCSAGEVSAMITVLDEYGQFIESNIAKNASLLAQCDVSDRGGNNGVWKTRTAMALDVSAVADRLAAPEQTIYLTVTEK